jgi:hypothetical protein
MTTMAAVGSFITRNRVIVITIAASLGLHLFWLTIVSIVAPTVRKPVRFSRVSFLGPILSHGVTEVRIRSRERTLLEERHLERLERAADPASSPALKRPAAAGSGSAAFRKRLTSLIDTAVSGAKLEPAPGTD